MITREYVTLFLVGSCLLLECSSQIPLKAQLQSRIKSAMMSARGDTGNKSVKSSIGEVTSLEHSTRLRRHGRLRAHRIKRGWVWNQFFVLEEYMGSEPQYVGKVSKCLLYLKMKSSTCIKCSRFSLSLSCYFNTENVSVKGTFIK